MSRPPQIWRNRRSTYRLLGNICANCQAIHFPPRSICNACKSRELKEKALSGKGTVVTFTVVHNNQSTCQTEEGSHSFLTFPYVLAIVALEEGPRITTQIVDCDPQEITIGDSVHMVFRKLQETSDEGVIQYGFKFIKTQED